MNIDASVSSLGAKLLPELSSLCRAHPESRCDVFSHRHADEAHVFGISCEIADPLSDFRFLILRVAVVVLGSQWIKGEVTWFRAPDKLGAVDARVAVDGVADDSIIAFQAEWPKLSAAFESAIARKKPLCAA